MYETARITLHILVEDDSTIFAMCWNDESAEFDTGLTRIEFVAMYKSLVNMAGKQPDVNVLKNDGERTQVILSWETEHDKRSYLDAVIRASGGFIAGSLEYCAWRGSNQGGWVWILRIC